MFFGNKKGDADKAAAKPPEAATSVAPQAAATSSAPASASDEVRSKAKAPRVFISYRRSSGTIVEHIHEKLTKRLRDVPIFLDRNDIDPGAQFPDRIRTAVEAATIVLVIIGREWISVQDPRTFRRRLDMPQDWVRQEIEIALTSNATVIPVVIEGVAEPGAEQLPDSIARLAEHNAVKISVDHFNDDVEKLADFVLKKLGAERARSILEDRDKFPEPAPLKPVPLSQEQIAQAVEHLPQWRLVESALHDDERFGPKHQRIELVREFRFESFLDAIAFMRDAAEKIEVLNHHPRWENVFRTVTVWLSTWDIGHRPSDRDLKEAMMLEELYRKYLARRH